MVIKVAGKEISQRKLYLEQKLFNLDKLCNLIIVKYTFRLSGALYRIQST